MPLVTLFDISGILLEIDPAESSTCVMVISVGQPYYEGSAFEAIIKTLNVAKFTKIVIVVADTLQKHTMLLSGLSPEEASRLAHDKGRAWVKGILKYLPHLENSMAELDIDGIAPLPGATTFAPSVTLQLPCCIKYWDSFLSLPAYSSMYSFVTRKYESSEKEHAHSTQKRPGFYSTINEISTGFFEAYLSAHTDEPGFSYENAVAINREHAPCLKYIQEELAVTLLFDTLSSTGKTYIAYPHILPASKQMANICGILFHDQEKGLRFIDLRFSGIEFGLGTKTKKKMHRPKLEDPSDPVPRASSAPTRMQKPEQPSELAIAPEASTAGSPTDSQKIMQDVLRRVVSVAAELDTPTRAKFVSSLLLFAANECLPKEKKSAPAFAFEAKLPPATTPHDEVTASP